MPAEVARDEFRALEREVEGEKMVTRHILEQTRRNGDDLAAVKTRLDRVETRLDRVENRLDGVENRLAGVEQRLGGVERKVDNFTGGFAKTVGQVVREVLDERDKRNT
jgi:tetrahydromethanopterin S-methyltransferase subunit G